MENDLITTIENYFISLAKIDFVPFYKKSLTALLDSLLKKGVNERDIVDLKDLILWKASAYKCEAADDIGLTFPSERPKILILLDRINQDKLKNSLEGNPARIIDEFNRTFKENGFKSKIEYIRSNKLLAAVKKIKYSNNAIYNIKLIISHGLVGEALHYVGRYGDAPLPELQQRVAEVATIRANELTPEIETAVLTDKIVGFLEKVGHPKISLKDKDLDSLNQVLTYHYFVLKALLRARTEGISTSVSGSLLSDYIALEIVRESEGD